MIDSDYKLTRALIAEIRPMLALQPIWVQGPVLAFLLTDYLGNIDLQYDYKMTEQLRSELLEVLLNTAQQLVMVRDKFDVAGHG